LVLFITVHPGKYLPRKFMGFRLDKTRLIKEGRMAKVEGGPSGYGETMG
jgi:hypothetical protein